MSKKVIRITMCGMIMLGILEAALPLLIPSFSENLTEFLCIGGSAAGCGIAFGALFFRCRHCGENLGCYMEAK